MYWTYLSVFSAFFLGIYEVLKKHSVTRNESITVLFFTTACGSLLFITLIILSYFTPFLSNSPFFIPQIPISHHGLIAFKSLLVAGSWTCGYLGLKHLPISIAAPMATIAPVITILGALLIYQESFTIYHWIGLLVTLLSYFFFSKAGKKEGIHFHKNLWILALVGAAFFNAMSALFDKFIVPKVGAWVVQSYFSLYIVLVLGIVVLISKRFSLLSTPFSWRWSIPLVALMLIVADNLYYHALQQTTSLIAFVDLIRRSNVIIAFIVGYFWFKERNFKHKGLALIGIFIGLTIILLSPKI